MTTGYISSTEFIKGAKESPLAKSESSDCVVRAIASATGMDYETSHQFVKEKFKRKNGKGTFGFYYGMNMFSKNNDFQKAKTMYLIKDYYVPMFSQEHIFIQF